jgi:hypothetical protein
MKKPAEKSADFLNLMVDWQSIEMQAVDYANKEIPKTKHPLTKTMLKVLKLDAEKHSLIQQMIIESVNKEAVNLSPEELKALSGHLNKRLEDEEKAIPLAEAALEKSELFMPRYLLSYLISELKIRNSLLRQFDDALKTASIPTSVTSKIFPSEAR